MLVNGSSSISPTLGNRNPLLLMSMLKELNIKPLLMPNISFLNTSVCILVTTYKLKSEIQLFVFLLLIKIVGSNLIIMISCKTKLKLLLKLEKSQLLVQTHKLKLTSQIISSQMLLNIPSDYGSDSNSESQKDLISMLLETVS